MDCFPSLQQWAVISAGLVCIMTSWALLRRFGRDSSRQPPGPSGWPLIGNIPGLIRSKLPPLDLLTSLADQYGDVFRIRIMTTDIVILNDYQLIKDAFNNPDLVDRPRITPIEDSIGRQNIGLAGSSGSVWKDHRQFTCSALRRLSSRLRSTDDVIHAEAQTLVDEVAKLQVQPLNPHKVLNNAVSNVISVLLFGKSYTYTDPELNRLQEIITENLQNAASGGIFIFIPILAKVPFSPAKQISAGIKKFTEVTTEIVAEHLSSLDPANPRDLIDLYLLNIQQESQGGAISSFDEVNLGVLIGDLFGASTETTTASLKWSILYMIVYPEMQAKVQDELDTVVGRGRLPVLSDRTQLPLTEATLHEIQRMGMVSPLGVAHSCRANTTIAGYDIRAGTMVVSNLWRLARDGRIWSEPDEFRPERFLNEAGECVKPDELIPFSTGKRACIGESLARKELFIFFTNLLHRFTFSKPADSSPPSLQGHLGFIYDTPSFEICVLARKLAPSMPKYNDVILDGHI